LTPLDDSSDAHIALDLRRPEAYPTAPRQQVALAETHTSWVFLTDEEAWKIKRPVSFGFLDFTTVDRRLHFCEEEIRLNRRLASDVYREVAPVYLAPDGHHSFVGPGPVVDYAVRMRRLPDAWSALARLRRGRLDRRDLDRVAQRLTDFYAAADETPRFGTIPCLRYNVEENFAQVRPFVGDLVDVATLSEVGAFQDRWLRDRAAAFEARVAAGRARDGHGDLRLDHVYFPRPDASLPWSQPEPIVIDCVEFSPRFRCGDVASDVAFFAMELDAAGRADLAAYFLSSFAAHSQDFDLYSVVDFYLSYRAFVRAKVACFVAADIATAADLRRAKREEAARLFGLSRAYAGRPVAPPVLVAVAGGIGTGKSTLADELGWRMGAPVIGSDRTRKWLAGLRPTDAGDPFIYGETFSRRTYQELFRRASVVLESGRGAILDATFASRAMRDQARGLAERLGVPFLLIEVRCAEPEVVERLRRRRAQPSVSDATEATLDALAVEPFTELPPEMHLVVDGGISAARNAKLARARLAARHSTPTQNLRSSQAMAQFVRR
jgi:aminoglycoside phosphotransferase family enzyme/predicted kinase